MNSRMFLIGSALALVLAGGTAAAVNSNKGSQTQPNVLIVLLDDTGFSQLGAFGGAISTPNIDRIASQGLRLTNFHTTALCSPSRAALLTGRNHHSVGTGVVTEMETDEPGYTGHIPKDKASWVNAMKAAGYHTAAFGKWHNTPVEEVRLGGARDLWPQGFGFERFYGFLAGDMSQWEPTIWDDEKPVQPNVGRPDYHFGADMTDQTLAWIRSSQSEDPDRPFFAFYAPGGMHAPHHAPVEFIEKYRGKFDQGWDRYRDEVFARQKLFGIMPKTADLPPRNDAIEAWDSLTPDQKTVYTRQQEVFAGFLEFTDHQIGRIIAELESKGLIENTIIIVTSDNGASGEGGPNGTGELKAFNGLTDSIPYLLEHLDELGGKLQFNHYPAGWAQAGNTPFKYWKQVVHEGGVRDPFIISWPGRIKAGEMRTQFAHMIDVGPTVLELTGVSALASVDGVAQKPFEGVSFAQVLPSVMAPSAKKVQYFEMLANRGVWADGWKAVTFHGRLPWQFGTPSNPDYDADRWELYDLVDDPTEAHDLAEKYPEKVAELKALFLNQAELYNVLPLDDSTTARMAETIARLTGGIHEFRYEEGDIRTGEMIAPPVKGRAYTITAQVTIPAGGAEGVLATAGGRFGGYAFYVQDGRLHYVSNYVGNDLYDITSKTDLPEGDLVLKAKFIKTGRFSGRVELYAGDDKIGEGDVPKTQAGIFSAAESFDVGEDTGTPISDAYAVPFKFSGRLASLVVTMDD